MGLIWLSFGLSGVSGIWVDLAGLNGFSGFWLSLDDSGWVDNGGWLLDDGG